MATFHDVQDILNKIIADWTAGNGSPPALVQRHHATTFAWDTRDNLVESFVQFQNVRYPLIQDSAKRRGQGATANIVLALTVGVPFADGSGRSFPRMPFGGLDSNNDTYLSVDSPQIQTLVAWIEAGCL